MEASCSSNYFGKGKAVVPTFRPYPCSITVPLSREQIAIVQAAARSSLIEPVLVLADKLEEDGRDRDAFVLRCFAECARCRITTHQAKATEFLDALVVEGIHLPDDGSAQACIGYSIGDRRCGLITDMPRVHEIWRTVWERYA